MEMSIWPARGSLSMLEREIAKNRKGSSYAEFG
jgi:hypothetical protein